MKTASRMMLSAALLGMFGCASNPIVGHGVVQSGVYRGDVGVSGHGTNLTIEAGSDVSKLSIIGDGCKVLVQEGARVAKIEFWGNGSVVSIPQNLDVSIAAVGRNRVVRRPVGSAPDMNALPSDSQSEGTPY